MTIDRALLARYFRQLADLGVAEVYLGDLTSADAIALLSGAPRSLPAASRPAARSGAGGAAVSAPVATAPAGPRHQAALSATAAPPSQPDTAAVRTLNVLATNASGCVQCRLHAGRTNVVFGEGNALADVVVVGEAPGQEEDRSGRPFVGRAGKLLDLLLMTAGFPRAAVYICNVLKCRPPENRNPLPDEVAACAHHLHAQLEAIAPKVLLAVGKFAAQALAGSEESIGRLRGRVHTYRGTPLIVTYHPAYLLRSPHMTRTAWHDFQLLRRVVDEQARD